MTSSLRRAGVAAWETLRLFVEQVIIKPVREGRLRDVNWPSGLRPIALMGLLGYLVAVVLVLGADVIRASFELTLSSGSTVSPMPRAVIWVTFALTALALSLGLAGALHTRPWVRWTVTVFTVLVLMLAAMPDLSWIARFYSMAASVGVILLVALRGRRLFAWWEFVVIAALVFSTFAISIAVVASQGLPNGFDFAPVTVSLVLLTIGQLAVPAALAAGASVAELAVSSAVWAATVFRERLGRVAVIVVLCLVVAWRVWDVVPGVVRIGVDPVAETKYLVAAIAYLGVIAASWLLIRKLRAARAGMPSTASLIATLASVSLLIASFLTLMIPGSVVTLATLLLRSFGGPEWLEVIAGVSQLATSSTIGIGATRVVVGLALIGLGILLAARGKAVLPELLVAVGVTNATVGAGNLLGTSLIWTPDSLGLVATVFALGILVWMLVARKATLNRLTAILGALLIAALFAHRDIIADPLAVLIPSAVAVTLLGFVWSFLTGYSSANEDSEKYPRPSRVMLVLANVVFATTVLAYTQLAREPNSAFDLSLFTELGQQAFGDALIACSLMVSFVAAARDRELT